ncbi:MAG: glycosyltransferase [Acidimicrobiales bacterium]
MAPERRSAGLTLERAHNRLTKAMHWPRHLNVAYEPVAPREPEYDLFFALLMGPDDVLAVNAVDEWRRRSGVAVAWLIEAWRGELDQWKGHWDLLGEFDHVLVTMEPCREVIADKTGVATGYLPYATDTLLFSPSRTDLGRPIDVLSLGRRSAVTHEHLIELARQDSLYYQYDSIKASEVKHHGQHRLLYASQAKRAKLFIANRSKIGADDETGGQHEFGGRFFDAAAAGAIHLGSFPETEEFAAAFDWTDHGLSLEWDTDPRSLILPVLADTDRLEAAAHRSIRHCLGRHDWMHRWQSILDLAGLAPTEAMEARADALAERAALFGGTTAVDHAAPGPDTGLSTDVA